MGLPQTSDRFSNCWHRLGSYHNHESFASGLSGGGSPSDAARQPSVIPRSAPSSNLSPHAERNARRLSSSISDSRQGVATTTDRRDSRLAQATAGLAGTAQQLNPGTAGLSHESVGTGEAGIPSRAIPSQHPSCIPITSAGTWQIRQYSHPPSHRCPFDHPCLGGGPRRCRPEGLGHAVSPIVGLPRMNAQADTVLVRSRLARLAPVSCAVCPRTLETGNTQPACCSIRTADLDESSAS